MLTEILGFVIALCFFLNLYLSWNDNYWLKQDIPFIEPKKFFGNIKDVILMKKTIGEVYTDIYRRLNGKPVGGFFKLRTPILMVREPAVIGQVLSEDFESFHDNDFHAMRDVDPILKMNPFLATGVTWKLTRALLNPCADTNKLKNMLPLLHPICQDMVKYIRDFTVLPVEAKGLSGKYTTEVVGSLVFGTESGSFRDPEGKFRQMTDHLFQAGFRTNLAILCAIYAPSIANLFKLRIIPKNVADYFINEITDICKKRVKGNIRRDDFLQDLINVNKESEASGEGTVYSYSQMAGHCITFLVDGYITTASTLCFCLRELAANADCQSKLREEIFSKGTKLEDFTYEIIDKLDYLGMIISESMRLHPPIQAMTRICTKDTALSYEGHEYQVKKGTPVTVPIQALHMDPAFFPEPKQFKPERFTWDGNLLRKRYSYMPFGEGPRMCLAMHLALMQIKMALISIVLNYEIELRDILVDVRLDPQQSYLSTVKGDVWLKFNELFQKS